MKSAKPAQVVELFEASKLLLFCAFCCCCLASNHFGGKV